MTSFADDWKTIKSAWMNKQIIQNYVVLGSLFHTDYTGVHSHSFQLGYRCGIISIHLDYNQFNSIHPARYKFVVRNIYSCHFVNTEFHMSLGYNWFWLFFGVEGTVSHVSDNDEEVLKKFWSNIVRVIWTIWIWNILEQFSSVYHNGFQKPYFTVNLNLRVFPRIKYILYLTVCKWVLIFWPVRVFAQYVRLLVVYLVTKVWFTDMGDTIFLVRAPEDCHRQPLFLDLM